MASARLVTINMFDLSLRGQNNELGSPD